MVDLSCINNQMLGNTRLLHVRNYKTAGRGVIGKLQNTLSYITRPQSKLLCGSRKYTTDNVGRNSTQWLK
jgi:hypothetical protein